MDKKKMTAISLAVAEYIKQEQAATAAAFLVARQRAMTPPAPVTIVQNAAGASVNQWAASGRQAQAAQRTLMQMRTFRR